MLIGRDAELAVLLDMINRAVTGQGSAICVDGEPGIGKTVLLDAAVDAAVSSHPSIRVVRAVGVEAEFSLPYVGLLDVLTPMLGGLDDLPAGQRQALATALGRSVVQAGGADRFLIAVATLHLLSRNAEQGPLLVVVDDVQWVDPESWAALRFSARRLGHDAIGILLTRRTFAGTGPVVDHDGIDRLTLSGLPTPDAGRLLAGSVADALIDTLVSRTGGNPLALLELTRQLNSGQRRGSTPLPAALPVGARLSEAYARSVADLSPAARRAIVLAATSLDTAVAPVARAMEIENIDSAMAFAEAEAAGVLMVEDNSVSFRHPLQRNAAWAGATSAERRSAHSVLAAVHPHRPGLRLRYLAEATTGPDDVLGADLLTLAEAERTRSGYAAASVIAERASSLLSQPGPSLDALADATEYAALSGDVVRVGHLLGRILSERADVSRPARARGLFYAGLLEVSTGSVPQAVGLLTQAVEMDSGAVRLRALYELLHAHFRLGSASGMSAVAADISSCANEQDPEQAMLVAYATAASLAFAGQAEAAAAPAARALELLMVTEDIRDDPRYLMAAGLAANWAGSLPQVFWDAPRRLAVARSRGAIGVLPLVLGLLAGGAALLGRHQDAFAYAGEAVELGAELGYLVDVSVAQELLAWELAARGRAEQAQEALREARHLQQRAEVSAAAVHIELVEAFCALCVGDLQQVIVILERRIAIDGGRQPGGDRPLSVAPDLVEAYLGLGRRTEALDLTARHAELYREAADPDVRAEAHRLAALIAENQAESEAAFTAAHHAHAGGFDSFSAARTRLAHGQRLRRFGERVAAREQLRTAADAFRAMGLDLWVGRAESELAATGATARRGPQRDDALTSQETRVALFAASGMTNREIAAALFLSPRTVEHHITSVLRKRGLRSRVELAAAFTS